MSADFFESIAAYRARMRERLEREARARGGGKGSYLQDEDAALIIQASAYLKGVLGPPSDLLETLKGADRLLVLGEPGAGKTVALERLAWELCNGDRPTVPVLVRLAQYEGLPLAAWLRDILTETGDLRLADESELETFLAKDKLRCVFLLDGLNEVAPPHRNRLRDELRRWVPDHPRHPVILTSQMQDEFWRRVRPVVRQVLVIRPIMEEQARLYLEPQSQDVVGTLYDRLERRLRTLARTPLVLWLIKEVGAAGELLPGNRGELYERFVSRMLSRDIGGPVDAEISEQFKCKALAALAYHLTEAQRLTCGRDEAERVAGEALAKAVSASAVIGACLQHGLLAGEAERLWFAPHQTVQEYFAALALRERWQQEQEKLLPCRWWERMRGQSVLELADHDRWGEPFVKLAGLVDDADALIESLAWKNPWLALWCLDEGRGVRKRTRAEVEARSERLLKSPQVEDRRRAVRALAQIRNQLVMELLFHAVGDEDEEVANIAVRALVQWGTAVPPVIRAALHTEDTMALRAALRYLRIEPVPELWLEVSERSWKHLNGADRRLAMRALAQMRNERVTELLLRAMRDEDAETAQAAVDALVKSGAVVHSEIREGLQSTERIVRESALRYLRTEPISELWLEASERLWKRLDVADRRLAVQALAQLGSERVVGSLFRAAGDEDAETAQAAVDALLNIDAEEIYPVIREGLQSVDRVTRESALRYLRSKLVPALWLEASERLWKRLDVTDRRLAVQALAQLRNERMLAPLFRAAGDEDAETGRAAVMALRDFSEAVKPMVETAIQGHNLELWRAALRWLVINPVEDLRAQVTGKAYEAVLGMELVYVPAGPFLMGSDKAHDPQADGEILQEEVTLPGYWIGKYLVTVAQFQAFVEESEYSWDAAGKDQGGDDHPVVEVTLHDALAYCRWLAGKMGLPVTLPSEAEWEKAASWEAEGKGQKRIYPWPKGEPDARRCNFNNYVGHTTPVKRHLSCASPYGCVDMAGNVWEWTRSHWKEYPYRADDGREDLSAGDSVPRVVRGGAFNSNKWFLRCAYRHWNLPSYRLWDLGFRVVMSPFVLRSDP